MIVPQYWAEARLQRRQDGKQVTLRRFGWSDISPEDAQRQADARITEAMAQWERGDALERREPKVAYNGADGVPIREEIVSRHGETIITRNSYGARCLNTPRVLFADVDFIRGPSFWDVVGWSLGFAAIFAAVEVAWGWSAWGVLLLLAALVCGGLAAWLVDRVLEWCAGGVEQRCRARITRFVRQRPEWRVALYRTPAGLRLLALHAEFDPRSPEVAACFSAWRVDPTYAIMCFNQHCFRARVSAKPWRIGILGRLRPRPGVWPVSPERLPARLQWIDDYERLATGFAACRYLETIGDGVSIPAALAVQALHDEMCRARLRLEIA